MKLWLVALLILLATSAEATELGQLAATMPLRSWAVLNAAGAGRVSQLYTRNPEFDDAQAGWDSRTRRLFLAVSEHSTAGGGVCPQSCPKPLAQFDDDTNSWTVNVTPQPAPVTPGHVYNDVAWDDVNEVFYWQMPHTESTGQLIVLRYCVNNSPSWCAGKQGVWSQLPVVTPFSTCCQDANGLTYHATMDGGSLLFWNGDAYGSTHGGLIQFREATQTWTILAGSAHEFTNGDFQGTLHYSPVKRVSIFGGGNGNISCGAGSGCRKLWKITDAKTITALADAPVDIALGSTNRSITPDPVTGNFLLIYGNGSTAQLWELNPDGNGTWTLIDGDLTQAGKICNVRFSPPCSADFYGVP